MGIKGLIRDVIMAYVAIQLLIGSMNNFQLALILIITVIIFTIIGFLTLRAG